MNPSKRHGPHISSNYNKSKKTKPSNNAPITRASGITYRDKYTKGIHHIKKDKKIFTSYYKLRIKNKL